MCYLVFSCVLLRHLKGVNNTYLQMITLYFIFTKRTIFKLMTKLRMEGLRCSLSHCFLTCTFESENKWVQVSPSSVLCVVDCYLEPLIDKGQRKLVWILVQNLINTLSSHPHVVFSFSW